MHAKDINRLIEIKTRIEDIINDQNKISRIDISEYLREVEELFNALTYSWPIAVENISRMLVAYLDNPKILDVEKVKVKNHVPGLLHTLTKLASHQQTIQAIQLFLERMDTELRNMNNYE